MRPHFASDLSKCLGHHNGMSFVSIPGSWSKVCVIPVYRLLSTKDNLLQLLVIALTQVVEICAVDLKVCCGQVGIVCNHIISGCYDACMYQGANLESQRQTLLQHFLDFKSLVVDFRVLMFFNIAFYINIDTHSS